jgi:tetratricopeptide (TPR) repeat protein
MIANHFFRNRLLLIFALATSLLLACSDRGAEETGRDDTAPGGASATDQGSSDQPGGLPAGHPPIGDQVDPTTLPLRENGSGSLAELERARAATRNQEACRFLERGFHLTFTSDKQSRNYPAARDFFRSAIELDPDYAEAYRGLAYAEFNIGFNREAAMEGYLKAIEMKPDYGEAHYALAFMYAMDDLEKGSEHLKKALDLGLEDERNLIENFYPELKAEAK